MSHVLATPRDAVIRSWRQLPKLVGLNILAASLVLGAAVSDAGLTVRVSVADDGAEGDDNSLAPTLSTDGRFVAFESSADNLVPGDTNNTTDIFVRDRDADGDDIFDEPGAVATTRVSVASDGTQGNGGSLGPTLSADGRVIAFESLATTLVLGDTNGAIDTFVHERETGLTIQVSVASDGTQGNEFSYSPALSADGCVVAFASDATNLVVGDANGTTDVFVHDRQTGLTERVSVDSTGNR